MPVHGFYHSNDGREKVQSCSDIISNEHNEYFHRQSIPVAGRNEALFASGHISDFPPVTLVSGGAENKYVVQVHTGMPR